MRSLFFRIVASLSGVAALAAMEPCFGEDYLIIEKKSGGVQRVALAFAPDEIESFQVEAAPPDTSGLTKAPAAAKEKQEIASPPEAGPVPGRPVMPPSNEEGVAPHSPARALITAQPTDRPRKEESQFFESSKLMTKLGFLSKIFDRHSSTLMAFAYRYPLTL